MSCGEDTDVQSRGPLFVSSELCSGREACVPGPTEKWLPQGVSYTSTPLVCELVLPVNMCIVYCNLVMILYRVDLRYKLLALVHMVCVRA